jgi:uncharacterized membrane protein YeaQ/YmgE (transglycosylase-associated protein family)
MRLGLVTSALALQWVARQFGLSRASSWVAGLIYGFSTMQIVQGYGHLFLVFAPLPPLFLYVCYRVVAGTLSAGRGGLLAGLLLGCDFLISAERALMTIVVAAVGAAVALVAQWRSFSATVLKRLVTFALSAGTVTFAVLIVPLLQMEGRGHVAGAPHPWIQSFLTDAVDIIFPDP